MYVCMQVMVSGCVKIIGYLYEWHWYVCLYASYGEWVCVKDNRLIYMSGIGMYVCMQVYGEWVYVCACDEDNRLFI